MIERIQWTCPICNRRYAIPATAPTPSRCPECRQSEREAPASVAMATRAAAVLDDEADDGSLALEGLSALAAIQLEAAEEGPHSPIAALPLAGHAGPSRKTLTSIAPAFSVLAGAAILGAFAALFIGLRAAVAMEPTPARTVVIFESTAAFCGGLVAAFLCFSFREVIRLLLEIEENSRRP